MMNYPPKASSGLTLIELLVVIGIFVLLFAIGLTALVSSRTAKQLDVITDSIASKLEEAKTNAMSGKNGTNFGLAFSTNTYTYWSGTSYDPANTTNNVYAIPGNFIISSNTIPGTYHALKFARVTGMPDMTGSITISNMSNASIYDTITIGTVGNIIVIK